MTDRQHALVCALILALFAAAFAVASALLPGAYNP